MTRRKHPLPDIAWLRERYSYDPETGEITGPRGKPLTGKTDEGYIRAKFGNPKRDIRAHRLAFALIKGRWPDDGKMIDHINGNKADNRWSNLREVTASENLTNRKINVPFWSNGRNWEFSLKNKRVKNSKFCETWHLWQESLRHRPACAAQYRDFRQTRTGAEIRQARALSQARAKGWREAKAHAAPISATHEEWTQTELPL